MAPRAITFQSEINDHCGIRTYRNTETNVEFYRDDRGWWVERPTAHRTFPTWGVHDEPIRTRDEARQLAKATVAEMRKTVADAYDEAHAEDVKRTNVARDAAWRARHGLDRYESDPGRFALRVARDHEEGLAANAQLATSSVGGGKNPSPLVHPVPEIPDEALAMNAEFDARALDDWLAEKGRRS